MKNSFLKIFYNIIKTNFKTLIKYEFLYKLALLFVMLPIAIWCFNFTMHISGYKYITLENVNAFLSSPPTIILLLLILLFLIIVTMFDYISNIVIYDFSYHKKEINLIDVFKISFEKTANIIKTKNILIVFYILLLIPLFNVGVSTNIVSSIKVPEFIINYITARVHLVIIYFGIYIFLLIKFSKYFYTIHYMVIDDLNIKKASIRSVNLLKGKGFIDVLIVIIMQSLFSALFIGFVFIEIFLIIFLNKLLNNLIVLQSILVTIIWIFICLTLVIFTVLSGALIFALTQSLFYKHRKNKKELSFKIKSVRTSNSKKLKMYRAYINSVLTVFVILFGCLLTHDLVIGNLSLNIESIKKMEVSAHRGASFIYPENTLASFVGAKRLGADFIELDVHKSLDGKLVITHDFNLKRVAGINKKVENMTYDELKNIDVGSFFDSKFKKQRTPLLSEVLEYAKENNIKLIIEIKKGNIETGIEKDVIDLVNSYKFKDKCVIASLNYSAIENVKTVDPSFKTVYILGFIIGNINDLTEADVYSIEKSSINRKLVNKIHNSGKEVYAWTVNSEDDINDMIDMNVDNIITDNIDLSKKIIREKRSGDIINRFLMMLEG